MLVSADRQVLDRRVSIADIGWEQAAHLLPLNWRTNRNGGYCHTIVQSSLTHSDFLSRRLAGRLLGLNFFECIADELGPLVAA